MVVRNTTMMVMNTRVSMIDVYLYLIKIVYFHTYSWASVLLKYCTIKPAAC